MIRQPLCLWANYQTIFWLFVSLIIAPVRQTSHLEDSEDIQEKFPARHFPCFRVGRRIALIREHFCVNWLNLEAIWRRWRHMLRTPGHLSKVQATLGEQGEVMWGRGCGGSSAIISDFKAGCSVQCIAMGYVLDWRPIYNYCWCIIQMLSKLCY